MHTLRRKFVSESLIRSNLWAHSCSILLRSSRKRNLADIIGTRGRVYRNGDVRGGPNISESSSVAFKLVVGSVIMFGLPYGLSFVKLLVWIFFHLLNSTIRLSPLKFRLIRAIWFLTLATNFMQDALFIYFSLLFNLNLWLFIALQLLL